MKANLPVILLKGIVLLPNNDLRLEIDNDFSKNIVDVSELFHDNKVLIVCGSDPLEENIIIKELPKFGIIANINQKLELPNGKIRMIFLIKSVKALCVAILCQHKIIIEKHGKMSFPDFYSEEAHGGERGI